MGISLLELMHSRRQEDITVSVEEASRTISETIKINIDDRKKERKITALIFASSMAILLLISVFKNLAPVVWIAEAVGIIYLIASVLMFVDSKRNRSAKKMLIGILLAMIPLFILLLLLTTSVNVTYN